jgi:NAD(P)-dependent dehydrogenase (short-subunit alcohol dehydrogenase family)
MSDSQQGSVLTLGVGSPRGLGAAVARVFAAEGFPVVIAGRNHDKLRQAAESIAAVGRALRVEVGDVANTGDVSRFVASIPTRSPKCI